MNSRRDSGDRPLSVPNACDDGCAKCSVPQRSSCRQDFANFHGDTPSPSYQIGCLFAYERLLRARIGRPVENDAAYPCESGLSAIVSMALSGDQVVARAVVTPRPPMLRAIRTSSGSLTICRPWSERSTQSVPVPLSPKTLAFVGLVGILPSGLAAMRRR